MEKGPDEETGLRAEDRAVLTKGWRSQRRGSEKYNPALGSVCVCVRKHMRVCNANHAIVHLGVMVSTMAISSPLDSNLIEGKNCGFSFFCCPNSTKCKN